MRKRIYIDFSYLIILAATFGAVLVLGAVVAPVVFHTDSIINAVLLDNYNAGIIMGELFHRFSYWVYFVAFCVVVYEEVVYKMGQRESVILVSSITVVFSSLMFSAVYSPKIISIQVLGIEATQSNMFKNIHIESELEF